MNPADQYEPPVIEEIESGDDSVAAPGATAPGVTAPGLTGPGITAPGIS